jgi:hypothetical protein
MIKKIDQALKERHKICAKHSPAAPILVVLSELSRMAGPSSWASATLKSNKPDAKVGTEKKWWRQKQRSLVYNTES